MNKIKYVYENENTYFCFEKGDYNFSSIKEAMECSSGACCIIKCYDTSGNFITDLPVHKGSVGNGWTESKYLISYIKSITNIDGFFMPFELDFIYVAQNLIDELDGDIKKIEPYRVTGEWLDSIFFSE